MNSILASPSSSLSWIELGGVSYFTTYIFDGLNANNVNLSKIISNNNKFRIYISTQKQNQYSDTHDQ